MQDGPQSLMPPPGMRDMMPPNEYGMSPEMMSPNQYGSQGMMPGMDPSMQMNGMTELYPPPNASKRQRNHAKRLRKKMRKQQQFGQIYQKGWTDHEQFTQTGAMPQHPYGHSGGYPNSNGMMFNQNGGMPGMMPPNRHQMPGILI